MTEPPFQTMILQQWDTDSWGAAQGLAVRIGPGICVAGRLHAVLRLLGQGHTLRSWAAAGWHLGTLVILLTGCVAFGKSH